MADDEDVSGESFMAKHMSEAQPSREDGSIGGWPKNPPGPKGTDEYYARKYGKGGDPDPVEPGDEAVVNRRAKGDKSPGSLRPKPNKNLRYD